MKNPFKEIIKEKSQIIKINPIHEIVNLYYELNGFNNKPKEFYKGRYGYGKLSKEAKRLYEACNFTLEDSLWAVDKMKYKAEKGKFDWSIITCLKHDLL